MYQKNVRKIGTKCTPDNGRKGILSREKLAVEW
jgi:hypothetical protein